MDLQSQLYLAAGLGALAIGGGVLLREPGRRRNRLFAVFCAALALWNLAKVAELGGAAPGRPWHVVFLLGACAAVPVGLHFITVVSGPSGLAPRRTLAAGYAAAAALWLTSWTPAYRRQPLWNLLALAVLGTLVLIGMQVLRRRMRSLPESLHRNAVRIMLAGGAVGGLGGLTDFLPRGDPPILKIGPAAVLVFLLAVCGVLIRHRFLDVGTYLAGILAMLVGAAVVSLILHAVNLLTGGGIFPLFVAVLLIIAARGPVWRALLSGTRSLLGPGDPLAEAIVAISSRLAHAREPASLWTAFDEGLRSLPWDLQVDVHLRRAPGEPCRLAFRAGAGAPAAGTAVAIGEAGLVRLLEQERAPVTRFFVEVEATETHGARRAQAAAALRDLLVIGAELVVPLLRDATLAGFLAIGGERLRRRPSAELAAAFLAVGNQALASLDRIEAQEEARRRAALAAVGEMAAGLAHEVRNPVGAIRGAAQALAAGADAGRTREMLAVIEEETGRLGRVVGEFLDYARPAAPRREAVDVAELARRVLRAAEAAGLRLDAEVRIQTESARALGDPDQLQRAFANVIRNAGEAAGPGGRLRIEVGRDGAGRVTVRFEDNGPGIPPEEVARLFRPFHTTKPGGAGLGLALVHRVVETHGGDLSVEGRPGLGAAFTIALPAAEAA